MLCFHSTQTLQLTLNHHSKFPEQSGRPSLFDMPPLDSVGSREVQRQHQFTLLRGNWMPALGQVLTVGHLTAPLHGRRSTDVVILSGRLHHSSEILNCLPSVTQVSCFRTRFQIQVASSKICSQPLCQITSTHRKQLPKDRGCWSMDQTDSL